MAGTDITLSSTGKPPTGLAPAIGIAGEAFAQNMPLYRNPTDNKLYKAVGTSLNASKVIGFSLAAAAGADQAVPYMNVDGDITNVSGLTAGAPYFLSDTTAGALMRVADVGAGDWICFCGQAKSATIFSVHFYTNGVVHA